MSPPRAFQGRRKGGWVQKQLDEALLIFDRQAMTWDSSIVLRAASRAAATTKSLTLRPWGAAAHRTTRSASGVMRASTRAVRVASWGMAQFTLRRSTLRHQSY